MIHFSVVIPAFNRERELPRALASCLAQTYRHWEVIVVDDGSTDGTVRVADETGDSRVRVIRHEVNRGQGSARNTGVRAAQGEWVVLLDSDDELLPEALATMADYVGRYGPEVDRLGFAYRRDDGRTSPCPLEAEETLDYGGYLAWLDGRELWDFLACVKRATFHHVCWPEERWVDTSRYSLDFASRYRTRMCAAVLGQVHLDAASRLTYRRRERGVAPSVARELGADLDRILAAHGRALMQFAPAMYAMYQRTRAAYHFLSGERWAGLRHSLASMRTAPFAADAWGVPLVGLLSPGWFAELRASRRLG